jgi:branched-chain amino acid transport system substrate-binding protein
MKKLSTLACAAAFAMLSGAASAQISGNTVKVGVLTDMSGTYSDLAGAGAVLATEMAIADFIAEAKPEFKVEMVSADHQNKADIASNKAREWFEREGVDTATELVTTSTALAVMKVAKEKNRVALMSGPASTPITNEQCNDVTVHYTYDTYALANGTAKAVTSRAARHLVLPDRRLRLRPGAGEGLVRGGHRQRRQGARLGAPPLPGSDFSSFLLKAQASGAKIIGLANAGADTTNAIKQAAEFGITPKQSLAGLLMFISDVHSLGLQSHPGHVPDHRLLLGPQRRDPRLVEALLRQAEAHADHGAGRPVFVGDALPARGQGGRHRRGGQGHGADEEATPINDFFAKNGRSATTAAWCTTCTWRR